MPNYNDDLNSIKFSNDELIKNNNDLSDNINDLEIKNNDLKKNISNLKNSNSSAIQLYYDTNESYNKYILSNILITLFFIIGIYVFYMLQYKYENFIQLIDNFKLFSTS